AEGQLLQTLGINIILALAIIGLVLGLVFVMLNWYQRSLEQMATTDKLTGAANRHVFQMIFSQVVGNARRRNEAAALMCIDLDGFKAINDRYGHQAGDGVLHQFTSVVNSIIRESDTLCRWGGDEFLILMAGCNAAEAAAVAEKIRRAVDERNFIFANHQLRLTVSIGVTEIAMDDGMETAVARADQALYQAKEAGRNRTASL
ncbi:MAG TPA: GGDEF domain-containing protein, partial [Wenzhouxiangella sp.]|nr:GGDEF domain-containing protein [Wenzhouxiangella sp.]